MRTAVLGLAVLPLLCSCGRDDIVPSSPTDSSIRPPPDAGAPGGPDAAPPWIEVRLDDPPRTELRAPDGTWLATFTDGAHTVTLRGPARTFAEDTAGEDVTHDVWVRTLAAPFDGRVDPSWLAAQLGGTADDILAIAMQYVSGAPPVLEGDLQIAGDAHYGPLVDGTRQEGSDWNDYLGLAAVYPDGTVDEPEPAQRGSLDCSGYVRMVFGRRAAVPLGPGPDGQGVVLPRRAVEIEATGPGVLTIPDTGERAPIDRLAVGDLVFFDADPDDGPAVDHAGIYLGIDAAGCPRFLSSRKTVDGPTLGDVGGASCLDGDGLYARAFRSARRL